MAKILRKAEARLHSRIMDTKATIDNRTEAHREGPYKRAQSGGYRIPGSMK